MVVSIDPIAHLDDHATSPFDVITSLDQTIAIARLALAEQLRMLTIDAVRGPQEQYLADGMASLWLAREQFVACVEANDE